MSRLARLCAGVVALAAVGAPAWAQPGYPTRPISVVIPYSPGSQNAALVRLLGEGLREELGQPIVVLNKGGAGTLIGTQFVSRADPDGYTILMAASTLAVAPAINPQFNVDPLRDLQPLVEAVRGDFLIVGRSDLPANNVKELISYAKERPGKLTYSTNGAGSSGHMTMEYFSAVTGTEFLHVPYAGAGDALGALLSGTVDMMNNTVFTLKPQVLQGKFRAFAVTGMQRSPMLPDVPTVAESGYPGFNVQYWQGFFLPPKTPPEIGARLSAAFVKTLRRPDVAARMAEWGVVIIANTPAEFTENLRAEVAGWRKLVTERHLKLQ